MYYRIDLNLLYCVLLDKNVAILDSDTLIDGIWVDLESRHSTRR